MIGTRPIPVRRTKLRLIASSTIEVTSDIRFSLSAFDLWVLHPLVWKLSPSSFFANMYLALMDYFSVLSHLVCHGYRVALLISLEPGKASLTLNGNLTSDGATTFWLRHREPAREREWGDRLGSNREPARSHVRQEFFNHVQSTVGRISEPGS